MKKIVRQLLGAPDTAAILNALGELHDTCSESMHADRVNKTPGILYRGACATFISRPLKEITPRA